jgi:peroxin-16
MALGYAAWVRRHAAFVGSLEESARSLTLLLPDRFGNAEVMSESIYTFINLVGLYHSRILRKPNPHSTYSYYFVKEGRKWGQRANVVLEALGNVQVLLEMASLKFSKDKELRWKLILGFEVAKSISRSIICYVNKEPLRIASNEEVNRDFLQVSSEVDANAEKKHDYSDLVELYRSSGRDKSRHGSFSVVNKPEEKDEEQINEGHFKSFLSFIGELVHIYRPVSYVFCILKFGYSSWKSFLVSLALDLFSIMCKARNHLSMTDVQETKRRLVKLLYYLLRPPFFELFTK